MRQDVEDERLGFCCYPFGGCFIYCYGFDSCCYDIFLCLWQYLNKAIWNWRLMRTIMTTCHVYDKEENYVSFENFVPEESQPISFLKRVMPDYA